MTEEDKEMADEVLDRLPKVSGELTERAFTLMAVAFRKAMELDERMAALEERLGLPSPVEEEE